MTAKKSAAFLQALSATAAPPAPTPEVANDPQPTKARAPSRDGLKHIGGYFSREDVEKFAILRARLGLDNSQLIKLAIDDLFAKNQAKRAFGDA